jgi:predicted DCC family thiol-disulfide oxidoreductase YuxK
MSHKKILLVYDKECPACNYYCQIIRIRKDIGELMIVNARDNSEVREEITRMGLDIDQGMVLKMEDQIYYGSDAIHALSLISSQSGWFKRFNYWVFKSKKRAGFFYPLLRACRNVLLKLLGKTKINNLEIEGNDKF